MLICVSNTNYCDKLSEPSAIKTVCLEEKGIKVFLCLIHGNAACLKICLKVGPAVLVKPAKSRAGKEGLGIEIELVHHCKLECFPECPGRVFSNPGKTITHHHEFFFTCLIFTGFSLSIT